MTMLEKYKEIYITAKTKNEFIKLCKKKYPKILLSSFERRWYDLRKMFTVELSQPIKKPEENIVLQGDDSQFIQPDMFKLLTFDDMVMNGFKPNREFLRRYGFSDMEINWLIKEGKLQA